MRQKGFGFLSAGLLLLLFRASLFGQTTTPAPSQPISPTGTALPSALLPAGPFSFSDATVRLPAGAQDGTTDIILRSSAPQTAAPTLKDVELPQPLAAKITFELNQATNAPPNTWRYRVIVYGLTPSASQQHYALVTYADNKTQYLLYTVTNQPAGAFSWSVSKLPDPWVSSNSDGACTAFNVTAKDAPATDIKVSSTLVEQSTKEAITLNDLRLCPVGIKCDGTQPIALVANVPTSLQLCTTKSFHGKFDGQVVLASGQKPDGDIVLQHAQFTTSLAKLGGFLLILLGVALAFVAKVWARAKLDRDQALVPVALIRTQLGALKEAIAKLKPDYGKAATNINTALETLLNDLSDDKLDSQRLIPPRFSNPFGFTVDAAGLKTYLETRNPKVQLLSILVNEGVVPAANEDHSKPTDPPNADVKAAIEKIDAILNVSRAVNADDALRQVKEIVADLHNKLFPPLVTASAATVPIAVVASRSFEALQLEIQNISIAIWVLHGILTALSGFAVLILNNPGYGVPLDYILAIFWGFGLPTVLTSITPSSAASALNISIAKS